MKQTLSVVLAVYNEEKNLPGCLDSVKDLADEIVIVDGASTDKTVEIAKKHKAKIKITTNKSNFHINKQMAIDMATSDWILQLDGDERVSPEMKEEIKSVIGKPRSEINGYWIPRKNWFLGRFLTKGGQYPDYTLRLYKRGKGRLPQKDVHEQAIVEGKIKYLKNPLLHYPYRDFSHYLQKWNSYNSFFSTQIKDQLKEKNLIIRVFYGLGYLLLKPVHWFLTSYVRHKGFMDGWPGFVFSFFSALRFPASYIDYIGEYKFWSFIIIIIAFVVRIWNFPTRWGLGGDDSRDAMIALEAIKRHQLSLTGSFSSAGPFVFGPLFYWFIIFSYLILPFFIFSPWIMLEIVSLVTVGALMYLGYLLSGKKFSILIGILSITSPQLAVRSLSLGQHTFISLFSALSIICFLLLWQRKKQMFSFLMGVFIGLGVSFHYQAINLLIFVPALFFVITLKFKERVRAFVLSVFGFLIPSLPFLYWDAHQNLANIRNILDYFLIGQYRLYVPNSWKLFLFEDIPSYWSFVVGNFTLVGLVLFFLSSLVFFYLSFKKKISREFFTVGIIFFILLTVNRYYKGERSEGYMLYFLPFIMIFSTLLISWLLDFKNNLIKISAILVLFLITLFNFLYVIKVLSFNTGYKQFEMLSQRLSRKYPNTKFSLYDYKYKMYSFSMPLSLILSFQNKEDINGMKIGLDCYGKGCYPGLKTVDNKFLYIVNLNNKKKLNLEKSKKIWINVNQPSVYDDLIGWLNKNQLKSNFSLEKYIMNKIHKI